MPWLHDIKSFAGTLSEVVLDNVPAKHFSTLCICVSVNLVTMGFYYIFVIQMTWIHNRKNFWIIL